MLSIFDLGLGSPTPFHNRSWQWVATWLPATLLLERALSSNTKPTEEEARAAARKMLEAVQGLLKEKCRDNPRTLDMICFLHSLANVLDPTSVPKTEKRYFALKAVFKYANQGAKKAKHALARHVNIAIEVYLLNKRGKAGTSLVAKKLNMDSSEISRICAAPDVKEELAAWRATAPARKITKQLIKQHKASSER
jgi:hypothetical protein